MRDKLRHTGAVYLLLALLLAPLFGCSTYSVRAPVGERHTRPLSSSSGVHVVQRGESLFSIAWQHGLDYHTVAAWNGIRPPYTIYPGQKLRLRAASQARAAPPSATAPTIERRNAPTPSTATRPNATTATKPTPTQTPASTTTVHWQWPSNGPIVRRFDADSSGKKGILLSGAQGSDVRAAAAGQVVYAGSGLVGYGRLIIVKHNDTYLSAYGHNRNLLVKEGEVVRAGQVIAQMGSSGTNRTQLHFEIRRNGKSVDPFRYLPRR